MIPTYLGLEHQVPGVSLTWSQGGELLYLEKLTVAASYAN